MSALRGLLRGYKHVLGYGHIMLKSQPYIVAVGDHNQRVVVIIKWCVCPGNSGSLRPLF